MKSRIAELGESSLVFGPPIKGSRTDLQRRAHTHKPLILFKLIGRKTRRTPCRTSENPRGVGWRFFSLSFAWIDSFESPPSNWLRATRKPDVLVLSDIRG
jgi:hypothetical protein